MQKINVDKKTVLIVEDDPIIQKINSHLIEALGCHVLTANNGQEAIERCQENECSMVLMDVNMPVMNGLEATQYIRHHYSRSLPIVAFTTDTSEATQHACLQAGMNAISPKPLVMEKLKQLLQTYIPSLAAV